MHIFKLLCCVSQSEVFPPDHTCERQVSTGAAALALLGHGLLLRSQGRELRRLLNQGHTVKVVSPKHLFLQAATQTEAPT